MEDFTGPSYQKAVMGDPHSRVHFRGAWDVESYTIRNDASKLPLALAWPSMSLRDKVMGSAASVAIGVIGGLVITAMIA